MGPDPERGLDHGTWVPSVDIFPEADVSVVPLAMPVDLDPARARQLGPALAPLTGHRVLILGSGSLTHNL
jgi:4,5-DOPA dioxygenase extradiol